MNDVIKDNLFVSVENLECFGNCDAVNDAGRKSCFQAFNLDEF